MKKIIPFIVLLVLFSGCSNKFKLENRNIIRGKPNVSTISNTEASIVKDAEPILTIQKPEYRVDIYAFADGGDIHYVSVVIVGDHVSASVSDRVKEANSSKGSTSKESSNSSMK